MKKHFYILLRTLLLCGFLSTTASQAQGQTVYYTIAGGALVEIIFENGDCTVNLVGAASFGMTAIAICSNGQLYVTDNSGNVFAIDIPSMQTTLVGSCPVGSPSGLTCGPGGLLYGTTLSGHLFTIDPSNGAFVDLGVMPMMFPTDLLFYNGTLYVTSPSGVYTVDPADPSQSTLVLNTPGLSGLSIGPNCDYQLMGSNTGGQLVGLDLVNESSSSYCQTMWSMGDLTSTNEFNPPNCFPFVDLDDNNSSGASDADYFNSLLCSNVNWLPIADSDVKVSPFGGHVATMTLNLTSTPDAPNEVLVLAAPPPGIAVVGSGTPSITLTNTANVPATSFEQALRLVRYYNYSQPFTTGLREVAVSFVNTLGAASNTATARLWLDNLDPIVVDLGPDIVICAGETTTLDAGIPGANYQWSNGETTQTITVDLPGEYSVTVSLGGFYCPGTDKVKVTVLPVFTLDLSGPATICKGATANLNVFSTFNQQPLNILLTGSDSTQRNLTVHGSITITLKPLSTVTYNLEVLNPPSHVCIEILNAELTVIVLPSDTTHSAATICTGDSIFLAGGWRNNPGAYAQSTVNKNGCDSTHIVTLQIIAPITVQAEASTCDPLQVGTDTLTLQAASGCDSLVIMTVSLLPPDTTMLSVYSCDPGEVGVFTETLATAAGCDSVLITTVFLLPPDTTMLLAYSCDPDEAGVFTETLTNAAGCDSVLITTVFLLLPDTTALSAYSCDPADIGVFTETLTNAAGCDSVLITTVFLLSKDTTMLSSYSCDPDEVGVFTETLTNMAGCDSVLITTVSLLSKDTTMLSAYSCNPGEVGIFTETLTNMAGCDSVVITEVSLLPSHVTQLATTTCDPNGAGIFVTTLTNQFGCDSAVVNTVVFVIPDTVLLFATSCNPANIGVFVTTLTNQIGCDSTVIRTVMFSESDTTLVQATTCDPDQAGLFTQWLTTQEGCDSVVLTTVSYIPADTTYLMGQTCVPAQAGVFVVYLTNMAGCDSLLITTVELLTSDTVLLVESSCDPAHVGTFYQHLTNAAGCDSLVVTEVNLLPSHITQLSASTCNPNEAGVFEAQLSNQYGCDSTVIQTVVLLPSDVTLINLVTCDPSQVGAVSTILSNQHGCDSTVVTTTTLLPAADCALNVLFTGTNLPCTAATGVLNLSATLGAPPFTYEIWQAGTLVLTGVLNQVGETAQLGNLPVGDYSVVVTTANGVSLTATASIVYFPFPDVEAVSGAAFGVYDISCHGAADGSVEAFGSDGTPPYSYLWSNGQTTAQTSGLPAGLYSVTLTDANGCSDVAEVALNEPPALEVALAIADPACFDLKSGVIQADAYGGAAPYRYSLNGGAAQASGMFTGLSSGLYTITVWDANNCKTAEALLINAPIQVSVDLGDDIHIDLGSGATLNAQVNLPFDSLAAVVWSPLDGTECPGCLAQVVYPIMTTTYTIRVLDKYGCSDSDTLRVLVNRRRHIYIPNVFSPNGDGENDVFTLFPKPNTVRKIHSLQVFSRWGEMVYQYQNFLPGDPLIGWDGTHKGQPLNPAVFVWYAVLEFIDGEIEVFKGDVTLVR
jgi:gliding motility-associated-like protein